MSTSTFHKPLHRLHTDYTNRNTENTDQNTDQNTENTENTETDQADFGLGILDAICHKGCKTLCVYELHVLQPITFKQFEAFV